MKFIVNHKVIGYETVEIESDKLKKAEAGKELDVTIVLDESTNDKLYEYYNTVLELILAQAKVTLIIIGKKSKIRKALATLMVSYRNYNVYYVPDIDVVDAEYLKELESRKPTYEEVQTYLGGDVTGHVDIDTIILGITSIVNSGELDGLKTFVNNHINSIESFPEVINQMKKVVDSANSADLIDRIEELKKTLGEQKEKAEEIGAELKGKKEENSKLKEDLTYTQNELNKAKTQMEDLKEQASSKGSAVIKTYPVMNTSMINCKVMNILYLKEISYVQYTNSLVNAIIEALRAKKVKFKLLIYDDQNGISSIYKPAPIIGSTEYLKNKATFLRSTEKLVVVEPNPMIIEDILTYASPAFDVVIIYDRLKQANDITTGNNVHKYFIINSYQDYLNTRSNFNITDASHLITYPGGTLQTGVIYKEATPTKVSVPKERLDIPFIEDYNKITETAKISKYMKVSSNIGNKPLIGTIFNRMRI